MDTTTEEKFLAAVEIIKNLPKSGPVKPSNDMKLKFYSYYKQATEGPCELPKPGFWDIVNRAKWDAWSKLENMSKEDAMKNYVEEFVGIMKESVPKDSETVNEFYDLMGPHINLVPEDIRTKHGLVNGNSTKFLNNNTMGIISHEPEDLMNFCYRNFNKRQLKIKKKNYGKYYLAKNKALTLAVFQLKFLH